MAPTVFYRVDDETSCGQYKEEKGILARKWLKSWRDRDIPDAVIDHLEWDSSEPSPLISAYEDIEAAAVEYSRRVRHGRRAIKLWKIDTNKAPKGTAEYRNLRNYCRTHDIRIEYRAWHNSEHEWLFLNEIPDELITLVQHN